MSNCDIIIPVWNQLECTRDCVNSIERNTAYPYRFIIIDNASAGPAAGYLKSLAEKNPERFSVIRNDINEGFIKAVNKGIKASGAKYVCLLNNDTVVAPGWLGELVKVAESDNSIGIVNPSSNTLGQNLSNGRMPADYAREARSESGGFVELTKGFGFCMFMKRRLFEEIGLFDEIYGMGNFEDTDFSMRAQSKGYRSVRAIASYVYHRESRSFNLFSDFKERFDQNKRIFESRWGGIKRIVIISKDTGSASLEKFRSILNEYPKERSWVSIITPPFDTRELFKEHSNLSVYHPGCAFYISAFLKVAFKKKRPGVIYADKERFADFIRYFTKNKNLVSKKITGTEK